LLIAVKLNAIILSVILLGGILMSVALLGVVILNVIMLSVIILNVVKLSVVILNVPLLSNIMQSLVYAECLFAECRFTDCCGTLQSVRVIVKFVVKKKKRIKVILSVFQCLLNVFLFLGRLKHLRGNGICQDCLKFLVGYSLTPLGCPIA
jgi:hypothetical protein